MQPLFMLGRLYPHTRLLLCFNLRSFRPLLRERLFCLHPEPPTSPWFLRFLKAIDYLIGRQMWIIRAMTSKEKHQHQHRYGPGVMSREGLPSSPSAPRQLLSDSLRRTIITGPPIGLLMSMIIIFIVYNY